MPVSSATLNAGGANGAGASAKANQQAFGNADFLSIMMTEITNQDPMNPSDTSKMVEGMRQLQVLANTANEKFRADVTWAQQMVGTDVNVSQVPLTDVEKQKLIDKGIIPDVGYGNKDVRVDGFRVVDQTVWIQSTEGKNYPVDNIKQVLSNHFDTNALVETSNRLLGMRVGYLSGKDGARKEAIVTSVGYDSNGKVQLGVDGGYIRYDDIVAVTVPNAAKTP